jgi:hypothetical protein
MVTISYAITACNEHVELDKLLKQLTERIRPEDEIVVQMDITATEEVKEVVNRYKLMNYFHPLNKDFATFKNNLKGLCTKDYIFQIDADEYLSEELLTYLPTILEENSNVEMFSIPRINTVEGLTEQHIKQWGWNLNSKGWVNYPDYQNRILKNTSEIYWVNKVHEKLTGAKVISSLPPGLDLVHPKTIERQEKQNSYYNTI